MVDRRVGLQEVDVRVVLESARARRDDACAHGLTKPKWIADRYHGIADGNRPGGSQTKCGQTACGYFQKGDVGHRVNSDDLCGQLTGVRQEYSDRMCARDNVSIRDNEAV